jgi:hypothetical protein
VREDADEAQDWRLGGWPAVYAGQALLLPLAHEGVGQTHCGEHSYCMCVGMGRWVCVRYMKCKSGGCGWVEWGGRGQGTPT